METKNTVQTSITVPIDLWNNTQRIMGLEGTDNFSYYVQKSLRVNNNIIEKRNITEYLDSLNQRELDILQKEIKKRS